MRALKLGLISVIAGVLAVTAMHDAEAATSGGVKIVLTCGTASAGSGTFRVTASGSSSLVTVPCGGSATATNPAWMAGAVASVDQTAGPVGTRLATNQSVLLATFQVAFFTSATQCPSEVAVSGCPTPKLSATSRRTSPPLTLLVAGLLGLIVFTILTAMLAPIWVVGAQIHYFHRLYIDQPDAYREAMKHLALMPGMAWRIRLRSKLLRVPLPPGFEDAERVIREDKQRV